MNKKDEAASISGYLEGIDSPNPLVHPAHKKKKTVSWNKKELFGHEKLVSHKAPSQKDIF